MSFFSPYARPDVRTRRAGSALLLVLMVVGLLLLVVTAFTVFVRMELRSVAARQSLLQARANARLGLDLALGRLQHLAGPDTRTTATADVLRGDRGNLYRPGFTRAEANRNWVGVWDAASEDAYDPTAKEFLGWLVSGVPDALNASASPTGGTRVPLLSTNRVEAAEVVEVPTVDLENGRFAYWVSDEGLKARFDLLDLHRGTAGNLESAYSLRAPQRHGAELLTYDGSRTLAQDNLYPLGDAGFAGNVERLAAPGQLPLLGGEGGPAREAYREFIRRRFHDVTLVSEGLLTNSRDGGLKKDLSLAFEMPLSDFNASEYAAASPNAELPEYRPSGYPSGQEVAPVFTITDFSPYGFQPENSPDSSGAYRIPPKVRGPTWHFFRNFSRLYKETDPDRGTYGLTSRQFTESGGDRVYRASSLWPKIANYDTVRRYGGDANVWTYALSWNRNPRPIGRPILPAVSPIPTRIQTVMSIQSVPSATSTNRVMELYLDPVVTLMNPYNVPVSTGEPNGQPLQISILYQDVGFEMQVRDSAGTRTVRRTLGQILNVSSSGYDVYNDEAYYMDLVVPPGFVMEPGEVVIFSGTGERVTYVRQEQGSADSGVRLVLEPGVTASLPTSSGVRFPNMWRGTSAEQMASNAEMRTRFYVPDTDETKFSAIGRNRTTGSTAGVEPFFSNFVANARNVPTGWSNWLPMNTPALTSQKFPLVIYDAALKTQSSPDPINMLSHFNVRAGSYQQGSNWDIESQAYIQPGPDGKEDLWWGGWVRVGSWNGTWLSNSGRNGYWGGSNTAADGSRFVALFEVPRTPPLSIASLQHAQSTYMPDDPSMVVGNSYAHHFVDPDDALDLQQLNANNVMIGKTGAPDNRSQWTMTRVDWSYLLNRALWDGYFFSGLTPDGDSGATARQRFTAFQNGTPLPQSTLRYESSGGLAATGAADALFTSSGTIRPEAPNRSAAHLRVKGMFNVNSTSVEAWRALLASTRDLSLDVRAPDQTVTPGGTLFTRTLGPENEQNQVWNGFRNLSDAEIDRLAGEIVNQIQVRGPFLSLSDFVNRRLRPSGHPSQRAGPLQAAIDAAGLNAQVSETLADAGMNPAELNPFVRSRIDPSTPVAMGATGYLTQADVLTVIGPLLSNRSDTFKIRAFGETENGGAKAWCEAVVRRVPDYVDSTRRATEPPRWTPDEIPVDTGSYDTSVPKRRFEILSFRWLGGEDV